MQAIYELANVFMPQRGSILHFNLFSLLFTVTCLHLAALTQTVVD